MISSFTQSMKAGNIIELTKLFSQNFVSGKLTMTLKNVKNPESTQPVKGLTIETYDNDYLVDQIIDSNFILYTVKSGLFFSAKVIPDTTQTFAISLVTFELAIADAIP